jgi:hypothetical protein
MGFSRKTFAYPVSFSIPGNRVIIGNFIYPIEQVSESVLLIHHNSEYLLSLVWFLVYTN